MTKILLYDLEISPYLAWTYDMWEANVIKVERDQHIMCYSYKWLGEGEVHNVALPDFSEYEKNRYNDASVVWSLWSQLDKADIVVAHNARKFDNRISNERFIAHGIRPPSPYKTVDTLTTARRYFRFGSNSLANLSERLGIGKKAKATHAQLWYDCLNGDMKAWKKMKKYCNRDVELLEGLYLKLLPYISNHPNVGSGCPRCGSDNTHWRGYAKTNVSTFKRFQCQDCGAWSRVRVAEAEHPELVSVP